MVGHSTSPRLARVSVTAPKPLPCGTEKRTGSPPPPLPPHAARRSTAERSAPFTTVHQERVELLIKSPAGTSSFTHTIPLIEEDPQDDRGRRRIHPALLLALRPAQTASAHDPLRLDRGEPFVDQVHG